MRQLLIGLSAAVLLSACSKRTDELDDILDKNQQFADQMCECKDLACAKRVGAEMSKWAQDRKDSNKPEPTEATAEQKRRIEVVGGQMAKCMNRIAAASGL